MANFDDMKLAVEALSGGKNTVLLDDRGMPSIMVAFPKFKISDVIAGGSENIHPAFFRRWCGKRCCVCSPNSRTL